MRGGGEGGGDRPVEGMGGTEAVVEDERRAGREVVGLEVGVEDSAVGNGQVWHDRFTGMVNNR